MTHWTPTSVSSIHLDLLHSLVEISLSGKHKQPNFPFHSSTVLSGLQISTSPLILIKGQTSFRPLQPPNNGTLVIQLDDTVLASNSLSSFTRQVLNLSANDSERNRQALYSTSSPRSIYQVYHPESFSIVRARSLLPSTPQAS